MTETPNNEPQEEHQLSSFQVAATSLIHDLDALREILDPVMGMAMAVGRDANTKHLIALEKYGTLKEEDDEKKMFDVPAAHLGEISVVARKSARADTAVELLPRTFLVSFVSVYDAFLGRLIKILLETKPEILETSERQLSYKQLSQFDSIETARSRIIEAEVESVLRQSHSEQFKWLENKFNIKLTIGLTSWPSFIELTQRRNLFVHTHGVVSSQYISVCGSHGCEVSCKIGETLEANAKYLVSAYKCLYEIGVKLSQVLWRKLCPRELENADSSLNNISYELLTEEKYDLATRLLEFAVRLPKHSDDSHRRTFVINLAQAYKFSSKDKEAAELLDKDDWSACGDNYAICVAVIRGKFDSASLIMERIGSSGIIGEQQYLDWPVFKNYRESPQFSETFRKIFGHDPVKSEIHDRQQVSKKTSPEHSRDS